MKPHGSLCLVEQAPYFLIPLQWNQSLFQFLQAPFAFFHAQLHFLQAHLHLLQRDWVIDIGRLLLHSLRWIIADGSWRRHHHSSRVVRPHGITWTPAKGACAPHRSSISALDSFLELLPNHRKCLTAHNLFSLHCSSAIGRHLCPTRASINGQDLQRSSFERRYKLCDGRDPLRFPNSRRAW